MSPPFTVLHVCMGNICRSPMAERLLAHALRRSVGEDADRLYLSHGAGTGTWHVGRPMNPPAQRQLVARGVDPSGFRARQIAVDMIDTADLVLCAAATQVSHVVGLQPGAASRTFVLCEFGRLLDALGPSTLRALPRLGGAPQEAYDRGTALVAAVHAAREDGPAASDDLDDPWGMADRAFARVADQIERTVVPLAAVLTGRVDVLRA